MPKYPAQTVNVVGNGRAWFPKTRGLKTSSHALQAEHRGMTECWVTQVKWHCKIWHKVNINVGSSLVSFGMDCHLQLPNVQERDAYDHLGRNVWLLVLLLCYWYSVLSLPPL